MPILSSVASINITMTKVNSEIGLKQAFSNLTRSKNALQTNILTISGSSLKKMWMNSDKTSLIYRTATTAENLDWNWNLICQGKLLKLEKWHMMSLDISTSQNMMTAKQVSNFKPSLKRSVSLRSKSSSSNRSTYHIWYWVKAKKCLQL